MSSRKQSNLTPHRCVEELAPHPEADRIPVMAEPEFEAFRADVAERGLLEPIEITAEGIVLDGRQRLRAARELGLENIPVRVLSVEDELEHMLRAALLRRHLRPSQAAALVVELDLYQELRAGARKRQRANLVQATEVATLPPRGKTAELGACLAGVSARTVQDASTVQEHDAALFERVKQGTVSASVAARQVRRRLRDEQLGASPPLPDRPSELILADPPWQLGHPDSPHAPENHYATMDLDSIKAIEVPAADDAVLFMWTVSSVLEGALQVIRAWGFRIQDDYLLGQAVDRAGRLGAESPRAPAHRPEGQIPATRSGGSGRLSVRSSARPALREAGARLRAD